MKKFRLPRFVQILDVFFAIFSVLALATLVFEYGFYLSSQWQAWIDLADFLIILYFLIYSLLKVTLAQDKLTYLKRHWFNYLLVVMILIEVILFINVLGLRMLSGFLSGKGIFQISKFYMIAFQVSIILSVISHAVSINSKIARYHFHPSQVLLLSFLIIILFGTGMLLLPKAVMPGNSLSLTDALFTSTSATCVTGLIVVDTGTYFTAFGQLIILFLIQIGALGIMTYASFFALILGRNITIKEKLLIRDIMNYENMDVITRLVSSTLLFTLTMEIAGAALLYAGFQDVYEGAGERIFSAVFHSVSAFCNAGFSLNADSIMAYQGNYLVVLTIAFLIIFGGLGFPVILNLLSLRFSESAGRSRGLSIQSRLVFFISGGLILSGLLFYLWVEKSATLSGLPWPERILNAFFQSVTTRTAGFNSLDISSIRTPTILFFILLMFIGASPGSAGGGIKTTTIGILFAGVWSVIKGRHRIELFKKDIPFTVLNRSIVILIFSIFYIFFSLIILSITEHFPFLDIMFEAFSAFGTVGLSQGITPDLTETGRIVIILLMFFGRLGALTISFAITAPKEVYHYRYPQEHVMVG